jgi:hypothetical protein
LISDDLKLGIIFELVSTLLEGFLSSEGILIADYCALSHFLLDFQLLDVGLRITIVDALCVRRILHSLTKFVFGRKS